MTTRRRTGLGLLRALWLLTALWLVGYEAGVGAGVEWLLVTALGAMVAPSVLSRISRRWGAEAPQPAGAGRTWWRQAGAVLRRLRVTRDKAEMEKSANTEGAERRLPGLDPL